MSAFKKVKLIAAAALLSGTAVSHDETLAAIMWGGPAQSQVTCYLFNAGTGPAAITARRIVTEQGGFPPLTSSCPASLAANAACYFVASVNPGSGAHACSATFSTGAQYIRGGMDVRDSSGRILNSDELH